MTIKDFAQLCKCNTQTLRYYDKIGLLKPAQVDPWSGYRYYEARQAIDFVKIKNLQAADFSIQQIKSLLTQTDQQVFAAFEEKIVQQTQKLERIREIQKSYLAEKNTMEAIIYSMTDYLLSQCTHPEVLAEFGMDPRNAPAILEKLRQYLNGISRKATSYEQVSMTINDEVITGRDAVLSRIQSLTKENLTDTILLHDGFGHATEQEADPEPDFDTWDVLWQLQGWEHVWEFLDQLPRMQPGYQYCLWIRRRDSAYDDDLSYPLFLLGAVLQKQQLETIAVNCAATVAAREPNQFKLLSRKDTES